jgi:hypothetical protein
VADQELLSELRAIAERSAKAADAGGPEPALLETYEVLRELAGWTSWRSCSTRWGRGKLA